MTATGEASTAKTATRAAKAGPTSSHSTRPDLTARYWARALTGQTGTGQRRAVRRVREEGGADEIADRVHKVGEDFGRLRSEVEMMTDEFHEVWVRSQTAQHFQRQYLKGKEPH